MKTPVVFVDGIVFPGLPGEVKVDAEEARQLEAFWAYMGFGTLDVVLAFPERDAEAPGIENACGYGTLAEVTIEHSTSSGEGARLIVHGGHRVSLGGFSTHKGKASGWQGPVAEAQPAVAGPGEVDHRTLNDLQRQFFALLLAEPEAFDGEGEGLRRILTDPVMELTQRASAWRTCYMIAEFLVEDLVARREVLVAEEMTQSAQMLLTKLDERLGAIEDRRASTRANYVDFLEQILFGGLRDTIDGIDSARRMAGLGLIEVPRDALDELAGLREALDQSAEMMQSLVEELGEKLGR